MTDGGMCMLGGIYSEERCSVCGGQMVDNGRNAVCCPKHKGVVSRRLRVKIKYQRVCTERRFTNYDEAQRFLVGLRFKIQEGSFDARDYKTDNPLGFSNLAARWLEIKQEQIAEKSWNNLNNYINKASALWGNRNIKDIGYAEIEDFLFKSLKDLSSKSRANASSVLHSFWIWLGRRRILHASQIPDWPEVSFELSFRKTITKDAQESVLSELQKISAPVNPRIWIACKWLSTYFSIRPGELIAIKEGEIAIDGDEGYLVIPHPKEKKPKIVPLIDEDIALIKSLPRAFPDLPFFRHTRSIGGCKQGEQFGPRYLYKWWKKACANLKIYGVDLYGGTRHSTVIHLGQWFTPEELKAASFHSTNKAFERYFRVKPEAIKNIYGFDRKVPKRNGHPKGTQILPLKGPKT